MYDKLKPGGLKNTLHGDLYQLALLTLAASRAERNNKKFYLTSEAEEFEKFDDLVIDYGDRITFLQAKHAFKSGGKYTKSDLCASDQNDASLAKYFDSWMRLRKSKFCELEDGTNKPARYIFFTNKTITSYSSLLKNCRIEDDEFLFEGLDAETLQFKRGDSRNELIDAIRAYSEEVKKTEAAEEINLDDFKTEIKKAGEYLKKKHSTKKVKVNGVSRLSKKTMAIIKLSLTNNDAVNLIFTQTGLEEKNKIAFINWLRTEVTVSGDNIEEALYAKLGNEIGEFLNELIIKIDQPNQSMLFEVLKEELGLNFGIGAHEIFNASFHYMFNWLADPKNCVLSSETYGEFTRVSEANLNRFYLLGNTKLFEEATNVSYNSGDLGLEIELLGDYLDSNKVKSPIALIYDDNDGAKQRINLTIQRLKGKDKQPLKDDEWAFVSFNSIFLDKVHDTLRNNITKFIIIDCSANSVEDTETFVSDVTKSLNGRRDKKVVLIVSKDLEIEKIEVLTSPKVFRIPKLEDAQVQAICKGKAITVAGKLIKLRKIVEHRGNGIFELMQSLETLNEVLSGTDSPAITNSMPYGVYIPNDLVKGVPYHSLQGILSDETAELFVIEGIKRSEIKKRLSGQFEFIDSSADSESSEAPENNKTKYRFVKKINSEPQNGEKIIYLAKGNLREEPSRPHICLKVINKDDLFVTITSHSENIRLPNPLSYDFSNPPIDSNAALTIESCFSMISAQAGLGKSSYCINERNKWVQAELKKDEPFWVIRVNLPRLNFKSADPDLVSAFTTLATDFDWPSWQIKALMLDMKKPGMVRLLLDGLDEIKDERDVAKFNEWVRKIPSEVGVLLTTRPYATHKVMLPKSKTLDNYLTLKPYTEEQHRQYIHQFITAILQASKSQTGNIDAITDEVYEVINGRTDNKSRSLLGIPLESYIFCEALKPYILEKAKDLEFDIKLVFKGDGQCNIVTLYQLFVATKLGLFLEKHMGISSETTLKDQYRTYSFSANYTEILMTYAYKQAFNLPQKKILKYLKSTHYNTKMLEDVPDTGLAAILIVDGEYFINFNHETYQEYFTALFLLKGMLNRKGKNLDEIKAVIQEARYQPKYRIIMSMLAQLSLVGDPLINGWDASNSKQIIKLWNILFDHGDLLGSATLKLFYDCVNDFTPEQKKYLKSILEGNPLISEKMMAILDPDYEPKKSTNYNLGNLASELPYSLEDEGAKAIKEEIEDIDDFKEKLKDKNCVLEHVSQALENGTDPSVIARLMEEVVKVTPAWWDCDGGISAIALLGNAFSDKLAEYYLERMNKWGNNVPNIHRGVITLLSTKNLKEDVFFRCFNVAKQVFTTDRQGNYSAEVISVLRSSSATILKMIASRVDAKFSIAAVESDLADMLTKKDRNSLTAFKSAAEYLFIAFYLAHAFEYAAVISEDRSKIIIYCDSEIEIKVSDIETQAMFIRLIDRADGRLKHWREKPGKDKLYDMSNDYNMSTDDLYIPILARLPYKEEYRASIKELVGYDSWNHGSSYWSINYGISIVGFIGKFFNEELANRLVERSKMWEDNCRAGVRTLSDIHDILSQVPVDNRDGHYIPAVVAYNGCIEKMKVGIGYAKHIKEYEIVAISLGV